MSYATVLWTIQQAMIEMGLPRPASAVTNSDITVQQMLALLNRAGSDMVIGYPWQQLIKEYAFNTSVAVPSTDGKTFIVGLPDDWSYALDQTQWDRTNHWPLLGPKSAQEWQWLKGGILSSGPRIRYRILDDKLELFPTSNMQSNIAMEYISSRWLRDGTVVNTFYDIVHADSDLILFDQWVISAYLKLKYWEAKGLDTTAYTKDFVGVWDARVGKGKGAPVLNLAPVPQTQLISINNIPDGSWQT